MQGSLLAPDGKDVCPNDSDLSAALSLFLAGFHSKFSSSSGRQSIKKAKV
jgi:hypothetical protein